MKRNVSALKGIFRLFFRSFNVQIDGNDDKNEPSLFDPSMIGYKNLLKYHLINVGQVAYIFFGRSNQFKSFESFIVFCFGRDG